MFISNLEKTLKGIIPEQNFDYDKLKHENEILKLKLQ